MKVCTKCEEAKSKALFPRDRTKKDGFDSWCKRCRSKQKRRYTLNFNSDNNEGTKRQKQWLHTGRIGKDTAKRYGKA